jgi:hypothetical protein
MSLSNTDFPYRLAKICVRAGKEYYHLLPDVPLDIPLNSLNTLEVKIAHPKFCVISFPDCSVTIFASGRMLIEELPENSEKRVPEIVETILSALRR